MRTGAYSIHYVAQSGDCPVPADDIINFSQPLAPPAGCAVDESASTDLCEVMTDQSCSLPGGALVTTRKFLRWSSDASGARGTMTSSFTGVCSGTFSVVYTRL